MTFRAILTFIALALAQCSAAPLAAQTQPVVATCATLAGMVDAAPAGAVVSLAPRSDCTGIEFRRARDGVVTVNIGHSTIRGLTFRGAQGIRLRSGTIRAREGAFASGPAGYGGRIYADSTNIRLDGVRVTDAKKGLVIDQARNITIANSRFVAVGEDGIIASRTVGLTVTRSRFEATIGRASTCTVGTVVTENVASRDCAGLWRDGFHADAVQLRNGVTDFALTYNIVVGPTQGLTQMDTTGDAPLTRGLIHGNWIRTDGYHRLTFGNCVDCLISGNQVDRAPGSTKRAVILAGTARRCGNVVQDERSRDGVCP